MTKVTRLENGLTVIIEERDSDSVAVEVSVAVGSKDEQPSEAGLSHFLEHLLFEGTESRTAQELAKEIESLGGEFNAATSHERTYYYIHLPKQHLRKAVNILADMILRPAFDPRSIEKEKNVVLNEINVINDDPKQYQWVMLLKELFRGTPFANPTYGNEEAIRQITRDRILSFFRRYYTAPNITVSIAGNVKSAEAIRLIKKEFSWLSTTPVCRKEPLPQKQKKRTLRFSSNAQHAYMVIGLPAVPLSHPDAPAFEILRTILGKGQGSRLFNEIRTKVGMAYIVGAAYEAELGFGFFAAFADAECRDLQKARKILHNELRLRNITKKELEDAKQSIVGTFLLANEDNKNRADANVQFNSMGTTKKLYLRSIRDVSLKKVKQVIKRYFTGHYTEVLIQR